MTILTGLFAYLIVSVIVSLLVGRVIAFGGSTGTQDEDSE
jgi:hypothetical protein